MLLFSDQLRILFLFGLATSLGGCTTLAQLTALRLGFVFSVLTVDLGEDVLDAGIGIGVDEVAEQIGEA
jgi:hypothetical protein